MLKASLAEQTVTAAVYSLAVFAASLGGGFAITHAGRGWTAFVVLVQSEVLVFAEDIGWFADRLAGTVVVALCLVPPVCAFLGGQAGARLRRRRTQRFQEREAAEAAYAAGLAPTPPGRVPGRFRFPSLFWNGLLFAAIVLGLGVPILRRQVHLARRRAALFAELQLGPRTKCRDGARRSQASRVTTTGGCQACGWTFHKGSGILDASRAMVSNSEKGLRLGGGSESEMDRDEKLYRHILLRRSDADVAFSRLRALLKRLGFLERIKGDHHIYTMAGIAEILNLQPRGSKAKPYQIRQVRGVILKYQLRMED